MELQTAHSQARSKTEKLGDVTVEHATPLVN